MSFPPHLEYLKDWKNITWFHPCWGYSGFWKRITEFQQERGIDFQSAWLHRDMKRNKELYVTALVALCMQQDAPEKNGWWFAKPLQDPPDGVIGTPHEDSAVGGIIMSVREVEVVEYFGGSLAETIQKKLNDKKKQYEPNTALVCLLSPGEINEIDFPAVAEELKIVNLSLAHVFVVFHGFRITSTWKNFTEEEQIKEASKVAFIQLSPEYRTVSISPDDSCSEFWSGKGGGAWLKFEGRGRNVELRDVIVAEAPKLFD